MFTADEQLGGAKKKILNWFSQFIHICSQGTSDNDCDIISGLENSTRPLVFTSASGCRASEYFDISSEN